MVAERAVDAHRHALTALERLADGAALASVPYGSERWLCAELCRYLGEAILLEPEPLRARVAARARELAAFVRSHATTNAQ